MIRSNTHAFEILETPSAEVPYKAIRYLYYQKPVEDIREKVFFWLENAYNDEILGPESEYNPDAPFWYAIVAENYLEEKLIDPLIRLYTLVDDDWDFLNEQGVVLISKLCEKLGDKAIAPFLNEILDQIRFKSKMPYLYLFEVFRYIDPAKYSKEILRLLETKSYWQEALLSFLPSMHFSQEKHPELLAALHQQLELLRLEYETMETHDHIDHNVLKEIVECQKSLSAADYPNFEVSFWKPNEDWEARLRLMESRLGIEEEDEEPITPVQTQKNEKSKKISRNASCPCGSGKKYKRCCL